MFNRHLVFAAACLGMLLFGIVFLSLGSVNNLLAERFHLDDNSIGTLTALLPGGILLGSLVFGPVVDRFGYQWMLIICALLVLAGLEGMAFANSIGLIQIFVFLIGFGGGVLNGATNALVADISAGERGANLSLLGVFFGLGALSMPGTLALLASFFPPSHIVAGIGAFVLLPVIYFLAITFPPPKQQTQKFSLIQSLVLLQDPVLLLAGLALAIQSGMESMSNDWTTRYFKKVVLVQHPANLESKTLFALMALTGAMMLARVALGGLLKRVESHLVLFASVALTAAGSVLLMLSDSYPLAFAATILIGLGLAAAFPVVLGYIGDYCPEKSGAAFSTIFFIVLLGNLIINKTLGYVAQNSRAGIGHYTTMMLLCLILSALLLSLVLKQLRKNNPQLTQIKK